MPRNNLDDTAEPACLEFKLSRSPPPIQPWQDFFAVLPLSEVPHPLFTRSTIALLIISPQVVKGIPNVENSSESLMVVPLLANSSALQLPEISRMSRYPCDTNIISVCHLIETSATITDRLGVYYIRIQCLDGRLAIARCIFCNNPNPLKLSTISSPASSNQERQGAIL